MDAKLTFIIVLQLVTIFKTSFSYSKMSNLAIYSLFKQVSNDAIHYLGHAHVLLLRATWGNNILLVRLVCHNKTASKLIAKPVSKIKILVRPWTDLPG